MEEVSEIFSPQFPTLRPRGYNKRMHNSELPEWTKSHNFDGWQRIFKDKMTIQTSNGYRFYIGQEPLQPVRLNIEAPYQQSEPMPRCLCGNICVSSAAEAKQLADLIFSEIENPELRDNNEIADLLAGWHNYYGHTRLLSEFGDSAMFTHMNLLKPRIDYNRPADLFLQRRQRSSFDFNVSGTVVLPTIKCAVVVAVFVLSTWAKNDLPLWVRDVALSNTQAARV